MSHITTSNKIILDIIKIRLPLSRDTIIIPALVAASVTLRYQLPSIISVWLGNKHRSYSYVGKIYTAHRIIYHLVRRGSFCYSHIHDRGTESCVFLLSHLRKRGRQREKERDRD